MADGPASPTGLARTLQKLGRHGRRARRYAGDIKWLLGDFLSRIGWQSGRVVLSGLLHIGTKFLSVLLLYVVVHALSDGIPEQLAHLPLPPPRSAAFLLLAVALAFLLLALSSWLRFDVRNRGITLGRQYEEFCARRVFAMASRLPDSRAPIASRTFATEPMHLYIGYARHCGLAARQLTQLLPTLVSFVVGCAVMIWIDAVTTAGLALLALVSFLAQYPANHRAAQASRNWERSRGDALRRVVDMFTALRRAPTPIENDGPVLNGLYTDPAVHDYIYGFSDRSHAAEQAALVSRIGSHLVLCGAILLLGLDIVEGERSWAAVAAYVAVVRFTLADFVQVSTLANGFTRFHAQFTLYRRFTGDAANAVGAPARPSGPPTLRIADLVGGGMGWQPAAGTIAALLTPPNPMPSVPNMVHDATDDAVLLARIDRTLLDDFVPLRSLLALSDDVDDLDISRSLAAFGPGDVTIRPPEPGWLDRPASLGWRQELPLARLAALQAIAARKRGATVVAMDLQLFEDLGPSWRVAAAPHLANAVLLLLYQPSDVTGNLDMHLARLGRLGETAVLVADGRQLIGWVAIDGPFQPPPALGVAFRRVLAGSAPAGRRKAAASPHDEPEEVLVE